MKPRASWHANINLEYISAGFISDIRNTYCLRLCHDIIKIFTKKSSAYLAPSTFLLAAFLVNPIISLGSLSSESDSWVFLASSSFSSLVF